MRIDFAEVERRMIEENDVVKHLSEWAANKPLLITGLSGSGKTVCAQEIAKEQGAFIIPLDAIHFSLTKSNYEEGLNEIDNWLTRLNYSNIIIKDLSGGSPRYYGINVFTAFASAVYASYYVAFKDYPYYGLSKDNAFSVSNKNVKEAETNNKAMTLFLITLIDKIDKIKKLNPDIKSKTIIEGVTMIHLREFWPAILSYDLPIIVKRGSSVHAMVRACLRDIHNADIAGEDDFSIKQNLFKQFEIYFKDTGKEKTLCYDKFLKMLETRVVEGKLIEENKEKEKNEESI